MAPTATPGAPATERGEYCVADDLGLSVRKAVNFKMIEIRH